VSTPARERSAFGQFQLNKSGSRYAIGGDYSKVRTLSTSDMAEMLRDGATIQEVAEAFGRGVSAIQQRLSTAGWSATTGQPIDTFTEPEVKPPHASFTFLDQPWADQALCAQTDPESFFPEKGGSTHEAKKVCAACFVQAECLDWALTTNERFGIWGGLSERERRKLTHTNTERTAS
jgi:WhiB family redox-sensing transcriptional regulator